MGSTVGWIRLTAFAPLLMCLPAWAQDHSCPKLRAVGGSTGYQLRSGDARCEGFYQSPVSGASLELLSLTAGPVDYRLRDQGTLRIVVPDVSPLNSGHVQVQARALPLGTYYRMDAAIPSSGSMSWPMGAVLAPAQLAPDTIGVIGWVERDAGRIHVPVWISDDPGPPPSRMRIVAILRAAVDLDELVWRALESDRERAPEWKKIARSNRVLRAGQPIRLEFEPGREQTIEVKAKVVNSDAWFPFRLRMYAP
jgi:hypothetical protein